VKRLIVIAFVLVARPVFAQTDVRPFFLFADQRFSASTTFNAVFQSSVAPFFGGVVDVVVKKRFFVDVAISHTSREGQRAFVNGGEVFRLGTPLRMSTTPIEFTGGYRFRFGTSRVIPYAGAGVGVYSYHETADFNDPADDVNLSHAGFILLGGAEIRVTRWIGITGDAQYTRVPGILGQAGLSKDLNENDFGGVAGRLRVVIGR
jgi:hypothetical protein